VTAAAVASATEYLPDAKAIARASHGGQRLRVQVTVSAGEVPTGVQLAGTYAMWASRIAVTKLGGCARGTRGEPVGARRARKPACAS
jgi:hypothetical protein